MLTGVAAGNANVSYTVGSCYISAVVTINATPAAISGSNTVCTANITSLTDATSSGTWSSSNTSYATISAAGVLTGVAAGSLNISYTKSSCSSILPVTVNTNTITTATKLSNLGYGGICISSSSTATASPSGGTWSSNATAVASVNPTTGVLKLLTPGGVSITYTLGGCYSYASTQIGATLDPITGSSTLCTSTPVTLSNSTSGGQWMSSSTAKATVGATTGVVTGVAAGTVNISYEKYNCYASHPMTVNSCRSGDNGEETNIGTNTDNSYTMYPNPTSGLINFIQSNQHDGSSGVVVLNYLGDLVYKGEIEFSSGKAELKLANLVSGIYLITLDDNGDKVTFRVVVQQ